MLRMGDLLDADNNRFNLTNEFVFGTIPKSSENHWEKHKSTRHLLITPDVIGLTVAKMKYTVKHAIFYHG